MKRASLRCDLVVVGGGALGLWTAAKASRVGLSVVLLERQSLLASGASTNNEGWCHAGTYHLAAISDIGRAIQVSRQTRNGFLQTVKFAPEAVEQTEIRTFALLRDQDIDETLRRWKSERIPHKQITHATFGKLEPRVRLQGVSGIFEVEDCSIDARIVYSKLMSCAVSRGARVLRSATIKVLDSAEALVNTPSGTLLVKGRVFLYACGYDSKNLFAEHFDVHLNFGCSASHLGDAQRVGNNNLFYVAPGGGTMMHHGRWTIFGMNADGNLVDKPCSAPNPQRIEELREAIAAFTDDAGPVNYRMCTKVFCTDDAETVIDRNSGMPMSAPQLGVACGEPVPHHIWALPGKMTEAPFMADYVLLRKVLPHMGASHDTGSLRLPVNNRNTRLHRIAKRPIDTLDARSHSRSRVHDVGQK